MEAIFRYILNEKEVQSPFEWETYDESIERDDLLKMLAVKYNTRITFGGDGYDELLRYKKANGVCSDVTFRIWDDSIPNDSQLVLDGNIALTTAFFDHIHCRVEAHATDSSYFALMRNNVGIAVDLSSRVTKNGVDIEPLLPISLRVFNPLNGVYFAAERNAYKIKDVFTFLVSWMSDNRISFESNYLDNVPADEQLSIILGNALRDPSNTSSTFISYQDLLSEIDKKFHVYTRLEPLSPAKLDDPITVRLELYDDFFNNQSPYIVKDLIEITESASLTTLYSSVIFGSSTFKFKTLDNSLPDVPLQFKSEEYAGAGNCNTTAKLDLKSNFVIDHNFIEEVLLGTDSSDDDIFMIQYTEGVTNDATQALYYGSGPVPTFYNETLLSNNSWVDSEVVDLSLLSVGRTVDSALTPLSITNIPLDNIISDIDNGYSVAGPPPFKYTPLQDGFYDFVYTIEMKNKTGFPAVGNAPIEIAFLGPVLPVVSDPNQQLQFSNLTNTDEILVFNIDNVYCVGGVEFNGVISSLPFLSCVFGSLSSWTIDAKFKVIPNNVSNSFSSNLYEIEAHLSQADYDNIKADVTRALRVTLRGTAYDGWIKQLSREMVTGAASMILLSND